MDVSKQAFGQLIQHCFNLFTAAKLGETEGFECEIYLVSLMSDCMLGVPVQYLYQLALLGILKGTGAEFSPGVYTDEKGKSISACNYITQLFWWFLIVVIVIN